MTFYKKYIIINIQNKKEVIYIIDIISAKEAYNESKYRKKANEILEEITIKIKEACEQGLFTIYIDFRVEKGIINLIINDLKEKGYKVNCINEDYWYYITINWNLQ